MAKHRVMDAAEDLDDRSGVSARVLIFLAVAVAVLVSGVVWALVSGTRGSPDPVADSGLFSSLPPLPPTGASSGSNGVDLPLATWSGPGTPDRPVGPTVSRSGAPSVPSSGSSALPSPDQHKSPGSRQSPVSSPSVVSAWALDADVSASWWGDGMLLQARITTDGPAVNGWQLVLTFRDGIRVVNAWDAQVGRTDSRTIVLTPASYNSLVSPGHPASPGFVGSGGDDLVSCTINGSPCSGHHG